MSSKSLEKVIQRAISDAAFRRLLGTNPEAALRGFKLTSDEVAALRSGDAGRLMSLGIDQRMSKTFAISDMSFSGRAIPGNDLSFGGASVVDDDAGVRGSVIDSDAGVRGSVIPDERLVPGSVDPADPARGYGDPIVPSATEGYSAAPVEGSPEEFARATGDLSTQAGSQAAPVEGSPEEFARATGDVGTQAGSQVGYGESYPAHGGLAGPSEAGTTQASTTYSGDDTAGPGYLAEDRAAANVRDEVDRAAATRGSQSDTILASDEPYTTTVSDLNLSTGTGAQARLGQLNAEVAPDSAAVVRDEIDRVAAMRAGQTDAQERLAQLNQELAPDSATMRDEFDRVAAMRGSQTDAQERLAQLNQEVAPDSTATMRDEIDRVAAMRASQDTPGSAAIQSPYVPAEGSDEGYLPSFQSGDVSATTAAQEGTRLGQLNAALEQQGSGQFESAVTDASVMDEGHLPTFSSLDSSVSTSSQERLAKLNAEVAPDSQDAFLTADEASSYAASSSSTDTTPDGNVIDPGLVETDTGEIVRQDADSDGSKISDV